MLISRMVIAPLIVMFCSSAMAALPGPGEVPGKDVELKAFVQTIKAEGSEPVEFVLRTLRSHDLLIFDDAVHNAVDPFEFYMQLVRAPAFRKLTKYIFLELAPVNRQPCLDAYFDAPVEDPSLLYPVFQDISDLGMAYKSYFDLLHTIYEVNAGVPKTESLKVIAVSDPAAWKEIETPRDLEISRRNYLYRDYLMYRFILEGLNGFKSGRKGIFLTNTRHAYTGVRKDDGSFFWDTATFFRQWHPGKTMSIRFHGPSLSLEPNGGGREADSKHSKESNDVVVRWVRMGDGVWDCAFAEMGNKPVALPLANNPFGRHPYIGNHMLDAMDGQTMADAYDAPIFLAPLEKQRQSAWVSGIYSPEFRKELIRRLEIMYPKEQLKQKLSAAGVETPKDYINLIAKPEPEKPLPQVANLGSRDSWRH